MQVRVDGADALLARWLAEESLPRTTPRTTPLDDFPPPSPDHLDRAGEAAALLAAVDAGRPVRVSGEAEVGKTMTVTRAFAEDGARTMRDGIVYVFAKGKPYLELLQELFDAFFACEPPYLAREQQLRRELRDKQALLVLDSVDLPLTRSANSS